MVPLRKTIYLDNAATTFPKPHEVLEEMIEVYSSLGVSPGRGSYDLSMEAEERVMGIRRQVCQFFGGSDPERVIFSYNATDALNTLIQGLITPGSRVVSSRLEHNSVLRPLHYFSEQGIIDLDLVPFSPEGFIDPMAVAEAIRPNTCFVILTHASNVLGTVQPVEQVGAICRERGVPLLLDVTQTAGLLPIRMDEWGVSAVAFTGHKSLLGPTGIGGLVLSPGLDVKTTRFGGTGRDSLSLIHTQTYPHRLEAGTINIAGIFGLSAGLRYISRTRYGEDLCKGTRSRQAPARRTEFDQRGSGVSRKQCMIHVCPSCSVMLTAWTLKTSPTSWTAILESLHGPVFTVPRWSTRIWAPVQKEEYASAWARSIRMRTSIKCWKQ